MTKKELQISIGKNVKQIREQKNMPQQDLAGLCNIEKSNLSRIEAGNTNPTIYTLFKIAECLEVTLSELTLIK